MVSQTIQNDIDLEAANAAVADAMKQDDLDGAAIRSALGRIMGGQASGVAAMNGGKSADQTLMVYNRWDGREHKMPAYQVAKTLTARFPNDRDSFPPQVIGQIAWSLNPEDAGVLKREYGPENFDLGLPCYFSPAQQDEKIREDVKGAGLPFFCRKGKRGTGNEIAFVHFTDAMALEAHLNKHHRAYPVFTKYREERHAREREQSDLTTNQAVLSLIQAFVQNGGVIPSVPPSAEPLPPQTEAVPLTGEFLPKTVPCDQCGFESKSNAGLAAHKRGAHPEG